MRYLPAMAVFATLTSAATLKPITPANGAKIVGPYSPGIDAGAYVYVSGQGARDASGKLPATFDEQVRQCINNVKAILEAGGVSLDHVVWSQVFISDIKNYDSLNRAYGEFFKNSPPARSSIAVARMPTDTPVEIAVVAVRDLKQKKAISLAPPKIPVSDAVQVGNRVYVSGVLGIDTNSTVPKDPGAQVKVLIGQMKRVLGKAGLELRHMAYAHVYVDSAMPIKLVGEILNDELPSETAVTVIQTQALPMGTHIEISGVASRALKREGACTSVVETVYCAGSAGTIEQSLKRITDSLGAAGTNLQAVVASNVFIDQLENFEGMNKVYAATFAGWRPTRVTVQPTPKAEELNLAPSTNSPPPKADSPRVQITVIAVR